MLTETPAKQSINQKPAIIKFPENSYKKHLFNVFFSLVFAEEKQNNEKEDANSSPTSASNSATEQRKEASSPSSSSNLLKDTKDTEGEAKLKNPSPKEQAPNRLAEEKKLEQILKEQNQNNQLGSTSQKKVDSYAEESFNLLQDYHITLNEIENYRTYNTQLKKNIADQVSEKESIKEQITQIKKTRKEIVPLMTKILLTLEQFIALDIPFLKQERKQRVQSLQEMMDSAKFSVSEKYRKLMEALQFEMEYGKTIETYTGKHDIEDKTLVVNYLRVGRMAFFYQTLDAKQGGYWNIKTDNWTHLSSKNNANLALAIEIAKKLKAPSLITLPLPTLMAQEKPSSSPIKEKGG